MVELIISEKPDAAKRLAEALADTKPTKKTYNGVTYYDIKHKNKPILIGCAVGHLYNLTEKEKPKGYINFDLEWKPSYKLFKSAAFTKKYLDTLIFLTKQSSEFIGATDLDTEGETILSTLLKFVCKVKNAKRMRFSTLTKEDLINAYENLAPTIDKGLAESGETRHFADFYWGISSSRALTSSVKKAGQFKILSSGRVQSPTLDLLSHRELEIESFKPLPYWQLFAFINVKNQILETLHEKDKFWKEKEIKKIFEKCKNKEALVKKITKKEYETLPLTPFNITTLQIEAYRLFKFSPKQTLDIAQSLYLSAYISYPRTSSEKLPEKIGYDNILKSLIKFNEFRKDAEQLLSQKSLKPREGTKTDPAHISIYPSNSPPKSLSSLNEQQKKIYTLIVKRFLSTFAEPVVRESIDVQFDINKEIFKIKGTRTLQPGWTDFYKPFILFKEVILPDLKKNEIYKVEKLEIKKDETKPPKRYSQGSIIAEMEKRNLGTRATRSSILQILYNRCYIEDKSIKVTPLGRSVVLVLEKYVPDLVSEKLTRHFEKEMEQIQQGKKKKEQVLEEAKKILTKILEQFKKNELKIGKSLLEATRATQEEASFLGPCPNCKDGKLRILYSKKSKKYFAACNNYPKCKTTFSIPLGKIQSTGKICKYCKTPIIKVIRKNKRPFEMCLIYSCSSKANWDNNNSKQ